ncbi:3599_t:CDS:2 [Gigaspora margarita]|uniref:3599_t:CDS:1 n=1 Tax=Gigaspora margarita TaxID=4874 RepID=A0ABN7US54_GIGMA|nr:3599_t:CDS:2 [Gigaspora margarita]
MTRKYQAKHETYEPHQESAKKNLEDDKMKHLGIGTEKEETIDQQKLTDINLDHE